MHPDPFESGPIAGGLPAAPEVLDGLAVPVENVPDDPVGRLLDRVGVGALPLKQGVELGQDVEREGPGPSRSYAARAAYMSLGHGAVQY